MSHHKDTVDNHEATNAVKTLKAGKHKTAQAARLPILALLFDYSGSLGGPRLVSHLFSGTAQLRYASWKHLRVLGFPVDRYDLSSALCLRASQSTQLHMRWVMAPSGSHTLQDPGGSSTVVQHRPAPSGTGIGRLSRKRHLQPEPAPAGTLLRKDAQGEHLRLFEQSENCSGPDQKLKDH